MIEIILLSLLVIANLACTIISYRNYRDIKRGLAKYEAGIDEIVKKMSTQAIRKYFDDFNKELDSITRGVIEKELKKRQSLKT